MLPSQCRKRLPKKHEDDRYRITYKTMISGSSFEPIPLNYVIRLFKIAWDQQDEYEQARAKRAAQQRAMR